MTIRGFSILFYSIVYVQGTQSVFLKRTHYNKNGEEHILVIMNKNVNNIIKDLWDMIQSKPIFLKLLA